MIVPMFQASRMRDKSSEAVILIDNKNLSSGKEPNHDGISPVKLLSLKFINLRHRKRDKFSREIALEIVTTQVQETRKDKFPR